MGPPLPETFTARLASARPLSPRVRALVFERADGAPCRFAAGQWMSLVLPLVDEKGRALRRAYSIASAPDDGPRFELAVTQVEGGAGSTFLHALEPGATLEVKGPQGTFTRPLDGAAPSLMVATGTGVAPFRAMIADALRAGPAGPRTEPLWLLFGVRAVDEALYLDDLTRLSREHPCLRVELTLSRPPPGWSGRTGYVQQHVGALWSELAATEPGAVAYVCGVKKMLEAVRQVLRVELGLDRKRVHLEAYD